jgi:transforming growth factor-beta-induced protein
MLKLSYRSLLRGALCPALLALSSVASAAHHEKDIVDTAVEAGSFNTLVAAVQAAGLVDALKGEGPFTVFAPSDEAFAKLPKGTVEALLQDKEKLSSILLYHVVPGKVMASDVGGIESAETLFGQPAAIDTSHGVTIAGAKVVKTDIVCTNGVIHVIDSVMIPKDIIGLATGSENFSTLVAAIKAAGLVETLQGDGPFTVFAPTNDAFAKLPAGTVEDLLKPENKAKLQAVLTYHVVPGKVLAKDVVGLSKAASVQGSDIAITVKRNGDNSVGGVKVNDANVIVTDIIGLNGVVHVIDSVILPQ